MRGAYVFTGLAVFGVTFAALIRQPTLEETPRPRTGAVSGAPPMALEWSSDPSQSASWRLLAEAEGFDVRAQAIGGDWSWFETAAELADLYFVAEERRECDAAYGGAIDGRCSYSFHYLVEQVEEGTGRIVYARAILRDEDSMPVADVANDPGCEDYVGCLARARLGVSVPLPLETMTSEIAIHEHIQSRWGDPILFDPERLPTLIEHWERGRRHLVALDARGEITDVEGALRYRFIKSLAPYLHQHLGRIQEEANEDR